MRCTGACLNCHSHLQPVKLICMSEGWSPMTCKLHTWRPQPAAGFDPRTFSLWCNSANHCPAPSQVLVKSCFILINSKEILGKDSVSVAAVFATPMNHLIEIVKEYCIKTKLPMANKPVLYWLDGHDRLSKAKYILTKPMWKCQKLQFIQWPLEADPKVSQSP